MPTKKDTVCRECGGVGTKVCNHCCGEGWDEDKDQICDICNGDEEHECQVCGGLGIMPRLTGR